MTVPDTWRYVGEKIRYLRKANGLTLKQLARGCNLSANTISMVERSEVSPSIETICKIAHALGVSPSSLFLEICQPKVILQRASEDNLDQQIKKQTKDIFASAQNVPVCGVNTTSRISDAPAQTRYSFLCLCGQIELELDNQTYSLNPGDSLAFNSDAFHRWHNTGNITGIAVVVLSIP